jgi:catechol 2,3-dioxygenase-like lactoylglutathione lyase family enzyme
MLDHIILTVSDVKRSLAFYEAALKPLARVPPNPMNRTSDELTLNEIERIGI